MVDLKSVLLNTNKYYTYLKRKALVNRKEFLFNQKLMPFLLKAIFFFFKKKNTNINWNLVNSFLGRSLFILLLRPCTVYIYKEFDRHLFFFLFLEELTVLGTLYTCIYSIKQGYFNETSIPIHKVTDYTQCFQLFHRLFTNLANFLVLIKKKNNNYILIAVFLQINRL